MRIILFFDLPVTTKAEVNIYRNFIRYLKSDGFIMLQYSVYTKLCINASSAKTVTKRIKKNTPANGDVRYLIITEKQFQSIVNVNRKYKLQEKVTTTDRTLQIGGLNDEDK
jgi:CRISPR-associated protein Cas2